MVATFDKKNSKQEKFLSFIVKGSIKYGILSQENDGKNPKRKIIAIDKYGKGIGEPISQIFFEDKWIPLSEYQNSRKVVTENDSNPISNKQQEANKLQTVIRNVFSTFIGRKDVKIDTDFYTEKLTPLNQINALEGVASSEIKNSEFQNHIVRRMLKADKNKDTLYLEKRNISKEISEKAEEIFYKDKSESNKDLLEKNYFSILEAGIEGAYLFAKDFEKNKKENEDLCTNDRLDSFYKIDYIKVIFDQAGNIDSVYFIQIKTNKDEAEQEKDKVFKRHEEYLRSLEVVSREEFVRQNLLEQEGKEFLNSLKHNRYKTEVKKNKNICFAKHFYSATYFVDRNTRDERDRVHLIKEEKLLEGKDLTYIFN